MRLLAFTLLLTLTASPARSADPVTIDDYVGDWEMLITNSGATFRSCALVLERRGDALAGEMVWRWGSVWRFDDPTVATLDEKGQLLVVNPGLGWAEPLVVRRVGDLLEGAVKLKNGGEFQVVAWRGRQTVDMAGTWDMTVSGPNDTEMRGTLKLTSVGAGRVEAQAWNEEGDEVDLQNVEIEGNKLKVAVPTEEGELARLEYEVKGDRMVGKLTLGQSVVFDTAGVRRRKWGKPVHLIPASGLAGWKPREFRSDRFGWSCKDGLLTNGKRDIDIQSEAEFRDFRLHIEYKVVEHGNSGVYLRGQYEVQIADDHARGKATQHGNGAVYSRIQPEKFASKPPLTWQTYDITLIGQYLTVVLNGTTVVDNRHLKGITGGAISPFKASAGPLLLQGDHGKIWYRNVIVTPALPE